MTVCMCLCGRVCIWCKALYCAQSGAPILSQWARAKALGDPDLTRPLPPFQCEPSVSMHVRICGCYADLFVHAMFVCVHVYV